MTPRSSSGPVAERRRGVLHLLCAAILVIAAAAAAGCGGTHGEDVAAAEPAAAADSAAPGGRDADAAGDSSSTPARAAAASSAAETVETSVVRRGLLQATVTASGSIRSPRTTQLGPEVGGRLVAVLVDVGDTVREGAPVFRIDPEPYQLDLEEAEAGLALARAELDQAAQEMERARRLADQQVVPQQQLDTQVTHHAVQRARVTQAEAKVHRAKQDLDRTTVHAPYDGFVVERMLHEGAMLNPASVVLTLQQAGGYEAILSVPEAARLPVRPGDPVRLSIEGVSGEVPARVRAVNARIDPQSRTYEVRVPIVGPPPGLVKAGAFVRGAIEPVPSSASLLVDREAVLTRDGRSYVFRLNGGSVEQVPIELGAVGARIAEVHRGLADGDRVVVGEVVERLTDGARVEAGVERPLPSGSSVSGASEGAAIESTAVEGAAVETATAGAGTGGGSR